MEDVLLVTLNIDQRSFGFFESQRRRYFPAHLNIVPAHIMLFHKLPGEELERISEALRKESGAQNCLLAQIPSLRSLGRGVAYEVRCIELIRLRARLATVFSDWLTPQDKQGYRPHVTIQNKVSPDEARRTLWQLQPPFVPFEFTANGFLLWRYINGPWTQLAQFPFGREQSP